VLISTNKKITKNIYFMKERTAHIKVKRRIFFTLIFLFIAFICFSNKANAQGWSFTFQIYTSGNCGGVVPPVITVPHLGLPTKSQCESLRAQVLAIKASGGGCTVGYTCTPCTGSDIVTPGQGTTTGVGSSFGVGNPGDVSFDGQFTGKPLFTTHQSSAFEDWAREYRQQQESMGFETYLGNALTPPLIPDIPLTGNIGLDTSYAKFSYEFNPAPDTSAIGLSDGEGVVQVLTTTEEQANRDAWVNETVEGIQADFSQNYPDFTQTEVTDIIEYVVDIVSYLKSAQIFDQIEVNDIINNVVDLIKYSKSGQPYGKLPVDNSNSDRFSIYGSQVTYSAANPPVNSSSNKIEQKEPPLTLNENIDKFAKPIGLVQAVGDYGLEKGKDLIVSTVKAMEDVDISKTLDNVKDFSGVVGSALGGWGVGQDINQIYKDFEEGKSWDKTATDVSRLVRDGALLVAGIAVVGSTATIFGLPAAVFGGIALGAAVVTAAEDYYVDNYIYNKSK
jgi:hypothetical protein